jgi:putative transposase
MPQPSPPSTTDRIRKALVALGVPVHLLVALDLVVGLFAVVRDATRTRVELVAENALLRQQVIVLRRQVQRPMLMAVDRWWMVMAAQLTRSWRDARMLVQPATLLRWHRDLYRRWWAWKSRTKRKGQPTVTAETAALIREMATANRLWGAERIRGELLKLGLRVCKRTVQKYMRRAPRSPSGPRWGTFLRTHAQQIWACDFLQLHDAWFRPIFAFFIVEHACRRVVQVGVTRAPSDAWVAQQVRNATPNGEGPRFLLRDRDSKFGKLFDRAAAGAGIRVVRTPVRAPRASAICERFLGSVRRECLDHVLVLGDRHLERVLAEYVRYFNAERPHQGLAQQIPTGAARPANINGRVVETPVLGGLHHAYRRAA